MSHFHSIMAQLDEIKKILRSLLVSAPVRVTVSSLNKDFKQLEGCYIPYRELGYNSLLHLLHSIPDVLRVNGSSLESEVSLVITEKVAHVSDMVMKQKKPSKGRNARAGRKSVIQNPSMGVNSFNCQSLTNGIRSNSTNSVHKRYNSEENKSTLCHYNNVNGLSPFPRPLFSNDPKIPCFSKNKPPDIQKACLNSDFKKTDSDNSSSSISSSIHIYESPQQLLSRCERVPSLSMHMPHNIPKEETIIGKKNLGTQSKFEKLKLRALKDKKQSNSSEIKKTFAMTFTKDLYEEEGIISIENDNNTKVPLEIQNKLRKLIKCYPSGIRCIDLPSLYKEMFCRNLEYQAYGFDRLISLCINLENIFYCEQESDCDFKVYDIENPPIKTNSKIEETSGEIPETSITVTTIDLSQIKAVKSKDWDTYVNLIPEESLKLGEIIENNSLNEYVVGDSIKIVISEIYNPSKFWIYKNDGHLNKMMNSMQDFYRENKMKYIIPEFLLENGLYCVVHTLNEFQRAIVIDLLHEIGGYVKVYLIDYGTLTNLPREKVWFLSKEFCTLPAQAVEVSLAGIKPKEEFWSKQSTLRFKDMVTSKHIYAKILDKTGNSLSIHIAVSSMPLQILNDLLVQEGYAEYNANCEFKDTSADNIRSVVIQEKNPRKKLIERIRMKNQIKENH